AANGRIVRGYLGVLVVELDKSKAHALGLEADSGVFVSDVPGNTPASNAGLQASDVITAFDGKKVRMPRELTGAGAATPVGQSARVEFIRDGKPQAVTVKVAERPKELNAQLTRPEGGGGDEDSNSAQGRLGIQGRTVTPDIAEQGKLKIQSGVL